MRHPADSELGGLIRHNVERLLKDRGLDPPEFCRQIGYSRSAYSAVFTGKHGPRVETVKRLADAIGVQLFELFLPPVVSVRDLARVMWELEDKDEQRNQR